MPVVVVTRLRLRTHEMLDDFFVASVSVLEQAKISPGYLGADALAEANDVWWTVSAWQDRDAMRAFVGTEPHLGVMTRVDDWCDEATFAEWSQDSPELPDWKTSFDRIVADGQSATLTNGSAANEDRTFPAPVEAPPV
jgi:hypothetical protein